MTVEIIAWLGVFVVIVGTVVICAVWVFVMDALTSSTDKRLLDISGKVDKRLSEGFEKTVATFADVQKRLELIDAAQKKITELSSSVVSLQEVLADRTSRGTFGEVQLQALVANVLPESSYCMQYTLSNGRCVDCMLHSRCC